MRRISQEVKSLHEFDFFDYTRKIFGFDSNDVSTVTLFNTKQDGFIGIITDGEMFYGADRDSGLKFQSGTIQGIQGEIKQTYQRDESSANRKGKKQAKFANLKEDAMMIDTIRDFQKALSEGPYIFPGGYPVYFITADGGVLSHESAVAEKDLIKDAIYTDDRNSGWRVVAMEVNYEDPNLYCDHSGDRIPSAYAESVKKKSKKSESLYKKGTLKKKRKIMKEYVREEDLIRAIKRALVNSLEAEDVEYDERMSNDDLGYFFSASYASNGESEWVVYLEMDSAEFEALEQVKEDLSEEPSLFNKDWIIDFVYISEADKRMIAQEEAENLLDSFEDEDIVEEMGVKDE